MYSIHDIISNIQIESITLDYIEVTILIHVSENSIAMNFVIIVGIHYTVTVSTTYIRS